MENAIICLDTSILIDYFRKTKKENSILYQLSNTYSKFAVSIITKFEVYCGCKQEHMSFWDQIFNDFQIIPFDDSANTEAVLIYKELKKKNKLIEMPDILIGATARAHALKLATINKKHFNRIQGLELVEI